MSSGDSQRFLTTIHLDSYSRGVGDEGASSRRQAPRGERIPLERRVFDLFALALLAPLLALPFLIVTVAVFLDSPGSVFFRARRMG